MASENFKFIYNNKKLLPEVKINQSGLMNGSNIQVISFQNFGTRYLNPVKVIVKFSRTKVESPIILNLLCDSDNKVSDMIEKFENLILDHEHDKTFIFNGKSLDPNLTLAEAGISNDSIIYVNSTKNDKKK